MPAQKIIPKQFKRRGKKKRIKEDHYAPMYDFEDSDSDDDEKDDYEDLDDDPYNDDEGVDCYTHTINLEGQCWVLCDKTLLWPCNNSTVSSSNLK